MPLPPTPHPAKIKCSAKLPWEMMVEVSLGRKVNGSSNFHFPLSWNKHVLELSISGSQEDSAS